MGVPDFQEDDTFWGDRQLPEKFSNLGVNWDNLGKWRTIVWQGENRPDLHLRPDCRAFSWPFLAMGGLEVDALFRQKLCQSCAGSLGGRPLSVPLDEQRPLESEVTLARLYAAALTVRALPQRFDGLATVRRTWERLDFLGGQIEGLHRYSLGEVFDISGVVERTGTLLGELTSNRVLVEWEKSLKPVREPLTWGLLGVAAHESESGCLWEWFGCGPAFRMVPKHVASFMLSNRHTRTACWVPCQTPLALPVAQSLGFGVCVTKIVPAAVAAVELGNHGGSMEKG